MGKGNCVQQLARMQIWKSFGDQRENENTDEFAYI